jgi:hypothetical protein
MNTNKVQQGAPLMPMRKHIILAVHITDRVHHVPDVQNVLTEYGCSIRTRLGLHEAREGFCSPNGVIILEMTDDEKTTDELMNRLNGIEGVEVKKITTAHELGHAKFALDDIDDDGPGELAGDSDNIMWYQFDANKWRLRKDQWELIH